MKSQFPILGSLYGYTSQTNQVKETNSVVDIGFPHVAIDANGNPTDADRRTTPTTR